MAKMISTIKVGLSFVLKNSVYKIKAAINNENIEDIQNVVKSHRKILLSQIDNNGNPPICYAIKRGKTTAVKQLLELGSDPCTTNEDNGVPAISSAVTGDYDDETKLEIIKLLLDSGAYVDQTHVRKEMTVEGQWFAEECTPLMCAIKNESMEIVKYLVERGANVDFKCSETGNCPILWAAATGNDDILEYLCVKGDCKSALSKGDNNALHWLCVGGSDNERCALILLKFDCDINCKNDKFQTPLISAVISNSCKIVDVLCKNGADTNAKDVFFMTALDHAADVKCERCYDTIKKRLSQENDEAIVTNAS